MISSHSQLGSSYESGQRRYSSSGKHELLNNGVLIQQEREEGTGREGGKEGPQTQGQGPLDLGPDSSVIRSAETALNVLPLASLRPDVFLGLRWEGLKLW